MDDAAKINAEGGVYAGLDRYVARKRVLADLEALGLLGAVREHKNSVGQCDRCKTVVEPRLSTQWFIKIQPLADRAIAAVEEGHIRFTPEQYKKTYLNWMNNIHDWCISRQLWWGHRIPAWHCAVCRKITVPKPGETADPVACSHCGSGEITQETDVLDTWFSSGLLPISVFGWPSPTADFDFFYPTQLLVTGFDILFFWVARMIMLGCWFAADVPMPDGSKRESQDAVPFREVYIHALVRDANREKMSKTKGNVIDPIEIVKQYGTDAVRYTLASMASPGTDIAFNVARTEGYRAFANKIWNAARFIFMNVDRAAEVGITVDPDSLGTVPLVTKDDPDLTRWIWAEFHQASRRVNESLSNYRYDDAANEVYQFFWSIFCDKFLEFAKVRLDFSENAERDKTRAVLTTLIQVFEATLRLLSPFMPFITEELWHAVYDGLPPARSIALASYPLVSDGHYDQVVGGAYDDGVMVRMKYSIDLISDVLSKRKESGVPEKESTPIAIHAIPIARGAFTGNVDVITKLAHVSSIDYSDSDLDGPDVFRNFSYYAGRLIYQRNVDIPAERERLTKEIAKYEKGLASADRQLGNGAFLAKAPSNVVDGLKKQQVETSQLLEKAKAALAALPKDSQ
jgi:valyl-tRNA synthetase